MSFFPKFHWINYEFVPTVHNLFNRNAYKIEKQNKLFSIINVGKIWKRIIIKYDRGYGNTGNGVLSPGIPWMFGSRQTVIAKNIFFSILWNDVLQSFSDYSKAPIIPTSLRASSAVHLCTTELAYVPVRIIGSLE